MATCGVNLLGMELEVEMWGPTVHIYSALVGIAKQMPKTIVPVYSSPRSESVNCSTFLPTLTMLILAIMVSMLWYFSSLICVYIMTYEVECPLLLSLSPWIVSDPLWPHGLQHARLPCPSPSPRVCSDSCPSSWWCHPTISSSVTPFSSCPQSFPASGSFPMSWLLASGGQSIGDSASASVLPMNIQDWFPLGWTGLITLLSKGLSRVFSSTTIWKHLFFSAQPALWSNSLILKWLLEKL